MSIEQIKAVAAEIIAKNEATRDKSKPIPSTPINFSVEIHKLITFAESDQASAAKLLEITAKQLRLGVVHPMLAAYLADAFEAATTQPLDLQARELTNQLRLTNPNRRPAQPWSIIGREFSGLLATGISKNQVKAELAVKHGIDEKTALKYYNQYLDAKTVHDSFSY